MPTVPGRRATSSIARPAVIRSAAAVGSGPVGQPVTATGAPGLDGQSRRRMNVGNRLRRARDCGGSRQGPGVVIDLSSHGGVLHKEVTDTPGIEQKLPSAYEGRPGPGWLLAQQQSFYRG